ncbi:MAG: phosphoglucosamine mutase, partial [Labrys sp. (in: a-proteobacteria)]
TGDGLVAALQVLAVLKKADRPVSEVCHRFDPLPQILKNVRIRRRKVLDDPKVAAVIEGARKQLGDGGRLVIRPSGTEPVIRVMAEADDRANVETAVDEVIDAITKAAA